MVYKSTNIKAKGNHTIKTSFDFKTNELIVKSDLTWMGLGTTKFSKNDGDMYITSCECPTEALELFNTYHKRLSTIYDNFLNLEEVFNVSIKDIPILNSNLKLDIEYDPDDERSCLVRYEEDNVLTVEWTYCESVCNSSSVIELLNDKKYDFIDKAFVKIEDLPKFMHPALYTYRENELMKKDSFWNRLKEMFHTDE